MLTAARLSELCLDLDTVEEERSAIAYALRREAESLRTTGPANLSSVSEATEQFHRKLTTLNTQLSQLAGGQYAGAGVLSLADMHVWVESLRSRLPIQVLLDRARRLTGDLGDNEQARLDAEMSQLEADLMVPRAESAEGLANHPLSVLLKLVEDGGELSDEDWEQCHDQVRSSFGTGLASAAARGRLSLRPMNATAEQDRDYT